MKEEKRIQILADQLQSFLIITDSFTKNLEEEDYDLLRRAKKSLLANKMFKESAVTLTTAFGIKQDTLDEEYKVKTIDALIELFKIRKEYGIKLEEKIKSNKKLEENRKELLKTFGIFDGD